MNLAHILFLTFLYYTHPVSYTMRQRCVIANQQCFTLRVSAGHLTPEQRMDLVNDRLAGILPNNSKTPIHPLAVGPDILLLVGSHPLVTVTRADARANHCRSASSLASVWKRNLNAALK